MSQFAAAMLEHVPHVSLADLSGAGVAIHHVAAVTIVREVALRVSRGELAGIPSAHVIRLLPSGAISVEGPVAASGGVARAAHLLDTLLPGLDEVAEHRPPGALRLIIARALGTLDLPPYPSLQSFALALTRFASPDLQGTVRDLLGRWAAVDETARPHLLPVQPADGLARSATDESVELTISDIRRARRSTGLTLSEIAERSRIPAHLLRELEWGSLRHWPGSHYGRMLLTRYASATGLDYQLVIRVVWPLLEASVQERDDAFAANRDLRPLPDIDVPETTSLVATARSEKRVGPWRRRRMVAAIAIPTLLAAGVAPAVRDRPAGHAAVALPRETAQAADRAGVVPPPAPSSEVGADRSASAAPHDSNIITDAPADSPSFASAGSAMFIHAKSDGPSALIRAETTGDGAILHLTSIVDGRARNYHARPSPDGTRIAFDSDRDGERAVYIASAEGRDVRRVSGDGFAAIPSWSPDGGTIAFVRAEPGRPSVWNLWTTDLQTGGMRRLTSRAVGQPWGASWFPDGRRIAYSHETRLIVMDLESGAEREYPSPVKGRLVRTPAVAPDGTRVMFQVDRDGAWILDLDRASMQKVLADPSAEEYTWSPDGRRVAYHSRRAGTWGVWMMARR